MSRPLDGNPRISIEEIVGRLQIGKKAVYALLHQKEIPSIRIGRKWIISRGAYEQWERTFGSRDQSVGDRAAGAIR
jgi:excisionase family DNA binding protein